MSAATDQFIICPGCDLLLESIKSTATHTAVCPRCRRRLHRKRPDSIRRTLVLSLTGLLLYLPANFAPLLTFNILGTTTQSSLFQSALSLFDQGEYLVCVLVMLTGLIFPFATLGLLFGVSAGLFLGWQQKWMRDFLAWYHHLTEWAMTDIYLIAIFITIIKMNHTASIDFNQGFFCFIGLVATTVAAQASFDPSLFWGKLDKEASNGDKEEMKISFDNKARTGREAGLILCPTCHKIIHQATLIEGERNSCPRCAEALHLRKKNSVDRSWALIVTALLLTLPANLLPIMSVSSLSNAGESTIIDGIILFFKEGSYGIGLVILTASVLVPLFKITGMALILVSIHNQWATWLRHKALMFRFIQFIGRWSMLDIFVIALLCALMRFGSLSSVDTAPAALYFSAVVLCTMFAAISFDPRLLWDSAEEGATKKATSPNQ
ncbi:MAG: PqiA/YebS family transporter subunit [Candidatus Electrothrix aestuarii]|uniref:PqiA/YebS family transporter subunit n=1 Tax=Candidatus Electrothrix aestuarii TaxID=3062594 RepID=A0AAU8LW06_9BACT|nr:PqiA/YebS family transporter subunit [Candidatus Electrothrix aestuarii]